MQYSQFMAGRPGQEYHVIDARRVPYEMLARAQGDAAYVIRGEQARTGDQLAEIGMELIGRQTDSQTESLDREVVRWLEKRIAKVEPDWQPAGERGQSTMVLSDLMEKVQSEIRKCRQTARAEGRAEGHAEGHAEGLAEGLAEGEAKGKAEGLVEGRAAAMGSQRAGLLEMLALKFGELPAGWQEAVARLNDPDQISSLTIAVLTPQSRDEYGQLLLEAGKS